MYKTLLLCMGPIDRKWFIFYTQSTFLFSATSCRVPSIPRIFKNSKLLNFHIQLNPITSLPHIKSFFAALENQFFNCITFVCIFQMFFTFFCLNVTTPFTIWLMVLNCTLFCTLHTHIILQPRDYENRPK